MSSAGHILDMINRAKQNEVLKKSRRERTQRVIKAYRNEISAYKNTKTEHEEIPAAELLKIKEVIRQNLIKEKRYLIIKSVLLTILILGIVIYFLVAFWPDFMSLWFN